MATIQERPFSRNYSGLVNQSVIGGCIAVICVASHELMKRKRRGKVDGQVEDLGSVESWEFGYLYQGRSWAKRPSPPHPRGWALSWVRGVVQYPEERINELRGIDAALYIRFLRGCFWFTLAHTLTTMPILLPIHVTFAGDSVSPKSMTRASISSLVQTSKGLSLLWIHLLLLIWITLSWIFLLVWLCRGAFHLRAQSILATEARENTRTEQEKGNHPHPQYPFYALPPLDGDTSNRGIRLRTVMVTNIPPLLRSEKELREYFEYYLSHRLAKPALGVTTTTQPGFLNKTFAFLLNRISHIPAYVMHPRALTYNPAPAVPSPVGSPIDETSDGVEVPVIDRVVLVRKMTELASLLERREEVLRLLETAHIKLAKRTLAAVKYAMACETEKARDVGDPIVQTEGGEERKRLLVRTLGPFIDSADSHDTSTRAHNSACGFLSTKSQGVEMVPPATSLTTSHHSTVWDALLSLPRSALDVYQPLIHLSALFRGRTVPAIDFYTAKLGVLTSLITEKRSKAVNDYEPMSTAFVTFASPADARRACKFLAVHPANPLQCFVTMAPSYEELDWIRLMRPTFRVEFVKDWLVNLGVWGFTVFWVFPVSLFVGLVSIQNISTFWPGLERYLAKHPWEEDLLQSFVPTVLVSLLTLLIPLILLLIAKKAHTIATLSAMHDRIMTRYYKFLVVNVLVFFCVGTAALQSFLVSFKSTSGQKVIQVVADSFPTAGPFYVGWLIFTMAMHAGMELALFGLPLLLYPSTRRQVTPRKRAIGIRPRTFNYYYWLPNHVLVVHILLVFAVLNPLVIPFGFLYFCVQAVVIKNQLLHVYARNYEGKGQSILIRLIRYSSDGLLLSQVVFLAYMVVLKKKANVGVSAVLIILTAGVKMLLTRLCRARFERDDMLEADILCGRRDVPDELLDRAEPIERSLSHSDPPEGFHDKHENSRTLPSESRAWRFPDRIANGYATIPRRPRQRALRRPNPFSPEADESEYEKILQETSLTSGVPHTSVKNLVEVLVSEPEPRRRSQSSAQSPVTRHPPHPAWDDESSPDLTYDNPYYVRSIQDELWLPRDPLGLLNLDDTVNVHLALTTQPGSGKLSAWREDELLTSGLSPLLNSVSNMDARSDASITPTPAPTQLLRRLNGNERIELPDDITSRAGTVREEIEVDTTVPKRRRVSHSRWRQSSHGDSIAELGLGHARMRSDMSSRFRSFSLGSGRLSRLSSSTFATSDHHRWDRSASAGHERRSTHVPSHSRLMAPSPLIAVHTAPDSALVTDTSVISLREAVVGEAIVEEAEAAQEWMRQEEAEEERAEEPRSWLTAWIFASWR